MRFSFLSAVHLLLLDGDQILLSRRFNTGFADGQYGLVAGHLDGGESVRAAMIREAAEEAGIGLSPDDLTVVGVMHRAVKSERIDFFLTAQAWKGAVTNCEPDRCDDLRWFPLTQLPQNTIPYVKRAIDNYRQGIWFDEFTG
ncbi:MAG: NUDIX domain-containing protein [Anaerolineae bacterium]|nr:NUDIX domain-containing protein [Anaerolineae bacterium]